jgi:microcystin degradation protein MlrC
MSQFRIAVGQLSQESNSFVSVLAELELFENSYLFEGEDLLALTGSTTEVAGFLDVCIAENAEVVPLLATRSVSGGPLSTACYAELKGRLLDRLRAAGALDGVLISLHGSMLAVGEDDPEGDLLAAIRAIVGPETPVVATLDLHGNVTTRMVTNATGIIAYEHYPHDDTRETGQRGAQLLIRTLRGEVRPAMALAKAPILVAGSEGQTSGDGPMVHLTRRAREVEQEPGVLSISCCHQHPNLDVPGLGCSAIAITDGDPARAEAIALSFAAEFWERRHAFIPAVYSVAEAVEHGRAAGGWPVLLVDNADCAGGGASGDSVALLRELLAFEVPERSYVMVVDPAAAAACHAAGEGADVSFPLGYAIDPVWGEPLPVRGTVERLLDGRFVYTGGPFGGTETSMGPSAVLPVGPIRVLITSLPTYDWADEQYRAAGLVPAEAGFIGVKNPMNYRYAYRDVAKAAFVVDTPGPTPANITRLPYTRITRPCFPFEDNFAWK